MKNKSLFVYVKVLLLLFSMIFFVSSCQSKAPSDDAIRGDVYSEDEEDYYDLEEYTVESAEMVGEIEEEELEKKIVREAYFYTASDSFLEVSNELENYIVEIGGYIEHIEKRINKLEGKIDRNNMDWTDYVFKVPSSEYEKMVEWIEKNLVIEEYSNFEEDKTSFYYDQEKELELLYKKENKYKELLEESEDIEDLVALIDEITKTRFEIEEKEGIIKSIDVESEYSTFTLHISEVKNEFAVVSIDDDLGERMIKNIKQSFHYSKFYLEKGVLFLITMFFPLLAFLFVLFVVRRFLAYKKKRKIEKSKIEINKEIDKDRDKPDKE